MRSSFRSSTGFTLIELLISTVILASIILLAVLSYSTFLNTWESKRLSDSDALIKYRAHTLLRDAMESAYDYYVTDSRNQRFGVYYPYFKGEVDGLEFVTLSSAFRKGSPAAARIRVIKDDDGETGDLVYEEASLESTYIRFNDSKPEYKEQIVPYKDVQNVKIRYYGLEEMKWSESLDRFEPINAWQDSFQGKDKKAIPEMIEFSLTTTEGEIKLRFPVKARNVFKQGFFQSDV